MQIPDAVRAFALHPMRGTDLPPDMRQVDVGGAVITLTSGTGVQLVHVEADEFDVAAAIAAVRSVARANGKTRLGWWITEAEAGLVPELERAGLENRDVPGFEAVAHAMALVEAPAGRVPDDVDVRVVSTWEEFDAVFDIVAEVFATPPISDEARRGRWQTYGERGCTVVASLDGKIVGGAFAGYGPVALTMMAGAVLPEARRRGVYTAMVHARRQVAVERGTPALVVQAGRLSRPICERVGFQSLGTVRMFVDELAAE